MQWSFESKGEKERERRLKGENGFDRFSAVQVVLYYFLWI
jgi:hypothetical protein